MNPTPAPANAAGQRVLLINAATWSFLLIFLGYGVFNPAPPPARYSEVGPHEFATPGGSFLRAPLPGAPIAGGGAAGVSSTATEGPQPAVKLHGMAAANPRSSTGTPPARSQDDRDKTAPAKDSIPAKNVPPPHPDGEPLVQQAPPKARLSGFAPAAPRVRE